MTLRFIPAIMAAVLCLASCSDYDRPQSEPTQEENTYSFTAVLPGADTRLGYQEDPESSNLKMVWDEGDVIRLYPDPSMNDPVPYYDFIANTGAGTSHTVFVHQGYILNWEHWKGKAIYTFPEYRDKPDVDYDTKEFADKAYVQKKNGDTEHLKYAEHVLGPDGTKLYTEYWSDNLTEANLKHDHQITFYHPHTVVYKVMLRGFIFDIPGGSELRMSGDPWGDGVTKLTLGSKDDKEPFVKVGEYGKDNYQDNVLTAYIIRQVAGDVDGKIGTGGKLKFELLTYDELDGTVMPLDPQDTDREENPDYGPEYLTNVPWGDEYTWNVTATKDIEYKAGDFVVADLTDKTKDYAYPKVAVDLGLPVKWAAFNVGAKKIDEYGEFAPWGRTSMLSVGGDDMDTIFYGEWTSGDPEHDAASFNWGDEWRTPTVNEFLDLAHYADWYDGDGYKAEGAQSRWKYDVTTDDRIYHFKDRNNPARKINNVSVTLVKSKANDKYIYLHLAGNLQRKGPGGSGKAYYNASGSKDGKPMMMGILQEGRFVGVNSSRYYVGYTDNRSGSQDVPQLAASVRAVKAVKD